MDVHTDTFGGTFPYRSKYESVDGLSLARIDEGEGPPVVMVHGNPTWSYLYRAFIDPLVEAGYRAVAPDLAGFGRSEKPLVGLTYEEQISSLSAHLVALDLTDITLVVQDWGGPIGLGFASRHPERIARLVIMNARPRPFAATSDLPQIFAMFREPLLGEVLLQGLNAFVEGMVPAGIKHRDRITPELMQAYRAPFPDFNSRAGVLTLARGHPFGETHPDYEREVAWGSWVSRFRGPALLICALQDHGYGAWALEVWREMLPHAGVETLPDAGHYLQEDAHERIVPWILRFLRESAAR